MWLVMNDSDKNSFSRRPVAGEPPLNNKYFGGVASIIRAISSLKVLGGAALTNAPAEYEKKPNPEWGIIDPRPYVERGAD